MTVMPIPTLGGAIFRKPQGAQPPALRAPSYPPPVSHYALLAPTVGATPCAAPPGRMLLVLPTPAK
jgi:hypothetical protein